MQRTLVLAALVALHAPAAAHVITSGDLVFTVYSGSNRVRSVGYVYDDTGFHLGTPVSLGTSILGADGIVFAPDQDLLVGGQGAGLYKVDLSTGTHQQVLGPAVYHVMLDPSGNRAWGAGLPGRLYEFPLEPFGSLLERPLTGSDTAVTQVIWAGAQAFYTRSGNGGTGNFGRIDLSQTPAITSALQVGVPWAHGACFDPFIGHLLVFGGRRIVQIDPNVPGAVLSELDLGSGFNLDQGTVDGQGHAFVADNNGKLVFVDYAATGRIGAAGNYVASPFLASFLDDLAPLSGPGSPCGLPAGVMDFGAGWPGYAGRVPELAAVAPPESHTPFRFTLKGTLPVPTRACVLVCSAPADSGRGLGGRVLVDPQHLEQLIPVPVVPAWPQSVTLSFEIPVLTAESCGRTWYLQAFLLDRGASDGVSFSKRLDVRLGR